MVRTEEDHLVVSAQVPAQGLRTAPESPPLWQHGPPNGTTPDQMKCTHCKLESYSHTYCHGLSKLAARCGVMQS